MRKYTKKEPIPELICANKPNKNCNDGYYTVIIPIKYLLKAVETPAAFYEFKFIGLKYGRNSE